MKLRTSLLREIKQIIVRSKEQAVRSVDNARVLMYWKIGKVIFEEEQKGKNRAE